MEMLKKFQNIFNEKSMLFLFICYVINKNLTFTTMTFNPTFTVIRKGILYSIYLIFLLKTLNSFIKKKKINVLFFLIDLLILLIFCISKNKEILSLILVINALKDIKFLEIIKSCFLGNLLSLIIIVSFTVLGILPNWKFYTPDGVAYSLGYYYSTFPATYLFLLITYRAYIKKFNISKIEIFITTVLSFIVYKITLSKTAILLSIIVLFFELVKQVPFIKKKISYFLKIKPVKLLIITFPIFIFISSFAICFLYKYDIHVINRLNTALSNRIVLSSEGLEKYGIPPFGKNIKWVGNGGLGYVKNKSLDYNFVDNAYLKNTFDYGIILIVLLLSLNVLFIKEQINDNNKNYEIIFLNMIILIWGITEPNILEIEKNIFIIFIYKYLYNSKLFKNKYLEKELILSKESQNEI